MWTKIKNFIKRLFVRDDRIEIAVKIVSAIKTFTDTKIDDILIYVLTLVAPKTATVTAAIEKFISDKLPSLYLALHLIDVSDEAKTISEQTELVSKKMKENGTVEDEKALAAEIATFLEDGKLSYKEAKSLIDKHFKI